MRKFALAFIFWSSAGIAGHYVEVDGHGTTPEEAKLDGFRTAIELSVGAIVISDIESSGDDITKDFIGSYSAGYIQDYEIKQTHYVGGQVVVSMNVTVATSKIAKRMLSSSNQRTVLYGQRLSDQIDSLLVQRTQGDLLINNVLSGYPHNAFIVSNGNPELSVGVRRQVSLDIPYHIQWSKFWLRSMVETLDQVSIESKKCSRLPGQDIKGLFIILDSTKVFQKKYCEQGAHMSIAFKESNNWLAKKYNFYFPDLTTLDLINQNMRSSRGFQHVGLVVELKEAGGKTLDVQCTRIPTEPLIGYTRSEHEVESIHGINLRPQVNGDTSISGVVRLDSKGLNLSNVSRVEMHLEKTCI